MAKYMTRRFDVKRVTLSSKVTGEEFEFETLGEPSKEAKAYGLLMFGPEFNPKDYEITCSIQSVLKRMPIIDFYTNAETVEE